MKIKWCVPLLLLLLGAASVLPRFLQAAERSAPRDWEKRWVYVASGLLDDENMPKLESLFERASRAGYSGVLFSDVKMATWWKLPEADHWRSNAAKLRKMTADLGLQLIICVFPFGYSEPFLADDPNLAAGLPIESAPLIRHGDVLVPVETAAIRNGSFEDYKGHQAARYDVQDDPGTRSFIDTKVFKDGAASLRFDYVGEVKKPGMGRIFQNIKVEPWQQYRIRVWMKAEHLTADLVQIVATAGRRQLQYQDPVVPEGDGYRTISEAEDLTTDWVEEIVAFNSLGNASVTVGAGVWGGVSGSIWWDNLRIEAVPALNIIRRDSAPLALVGEGGALFEEGLDFKAIADPGLGTYRWRGNFDARHEPPRIAVPDSSRIKDGERVGLSCFHATIFYGGQVVCSLVDPKVFDLCTEEIKHANEALMPDGYMMSHDEIRCAGWEPSEAQRFRSTGDEIAYNAAKCHEIAARYGGGVPVYVWSDMFDPYHNAHDDYCLVRGTVAGSWKGLDSTVTVVKWGTSIDSGAGLRFFASRGSELMIAGYYDGDVENNYNTWEKFAEGVPDVVGVIYTTWTDDYSKLEEFARVWWGGGE